MATQFDCDMQVLLRAMEAAHIKSGALMQAFQAACVNRNWVEADRLSFEAIEAVQTHLDAMAMTYRRLEVAETKGR